MRLKSANDFHLTERKERIPVTFIRESLSLIRFLTVARKTVATWLHFTGFRFSTAVAVSLRASSPIAARSRVLARHVSLAQIGELARRLSGGLITSSCFKTGPEIASEIEPGCGVVKVCFFHGFNYSF